MQSKIMLLAMQQQQDQRCRALSLLLLKKLDRDGVVGNKRFIITCYQNANSSKTFRDGKIKSSMQLIPLKLWGSLSLFLVLTIQIKREKEEIDKHRCSMKDLFNVYVDIPSFLPDRIAKISRKLVI